MAVVHQNILTVHIVAFKPFPAKGGGIIWGPSWKNLAKLPIKP